MNRIPDMQGQESPEIDVGAIENPAETTAGLVPLDGADSDPQHRRHLIAIAAYLRAERRQFQNGTPEEDWLQAEAEIDYQLRRRRSSQNG